jgi:hypothetical protein
MPFVDAVLSTLRSSSLGTGGGKGLGSEHRSPAQDRPSGDSTISEHQSSAKRSAMFLAIEVGPFSTSSKWGGVWNGQVLMKESFETGRNHDLSSLVKAVHSKTTSGPELLLLLSYASRIETGKRAH